MSKTKDVLTPQTYLSVALKCAGVSTKFENARDGIPVLATVLAANDWATLRDIAHEMTERVCDKDPKLDRVACLAKFREFLLDLQKMGRKAAGRLRKKTKKYFRKRKK